MDPCKYDGISPSYTNTVTHDMMLTTDQMAPYANDVPEDWSDAAVKLGYPGITGLKEAPLIGLACLAEMADRHEFNRWEENLDETLIPNFPAPKPEKPGDK